MKTATVQVTVRLKGPIQAAMRRWLREIITATAKKDYKEMERLITQEENERRAGEWEWQASCFDQETRDEKDSLIHIGHMAISLAK